MSGGNLQFVRQCLAGGLIAASLTVTLVHAAASEQAAFTTGVAAANIAWSKPSAITETMTGIAAAGFGSVRIGLKNPVAGTFLALEEAKRAGLDVLVTVPLIDGAVATQGAEPRARTKHFFPAFGLTQIDPQRYDARLRLLLERIVEEDLPVIGLQIGNELNWSGYNGDLALKPDGAVISDAAAWPAADRARFEQGVDTYVAIVEHTRSLLQADPRLHHVKLVSSGLADINSAFIRRVGASYVDPALVYDAFAKRGLFELVDAVGIHLYEPLRNVAYMNDRAGMIAAQLAPCGEPAFAERPCWITEYGAALPVEDCAQQDARRISLMQPLLEHLARPENARRVPLGFYYDWNLDAGFSLLRCGRPTALTHALPRAGDLPQDDKGGTTP
jgi:hypothetical protein